VNSTDGVTYSTPIQVTTAANPESTPSLIQDSNGTYWIAFARFVTGLSYEIFITNSTNGVSWSIPIQLASNSADDFLPSLSQDANGTYWIAFRSKRSGDYDIWVTNSTDGFNWESPTQLTADSYIDNTATNSIFFQDGLYWLSYSSDKAGNYDIYIMNSTNGVNWNASIQITNNSSDESGPSFRKYLGKYYLAFSLNNSGNWDLYIMDSTNGLNYTTPIQLTTNTSTDSLPSIIRDTKKNYYLVWRSTRSGNDDIWYSVLYGLSLTSPITNTYSSTLNISWSSYSDDPTNDTFSLYWSTVNGSQWNIIATGLSNITRNHSWDTTLYPDGSNYTIKVTRVNSFTGNASAVSGVFAIDNTPPSPISNLTNTTSITWLNWSWTNPSDSDFNHTMVYLDGVFQTNVSKAENFYNATSLEPGTQHVIATRTVDAAGNVNSTWVNQSARTGVSCEDITSAKDTPPGWSEAKQITSGYQMATPSLIQDSNGTYWIVFDNYWNGAYYYDLYYLNSSNATFWSTPTNFLSGTDYDVWPSLMQDSAGKYWVAFYSTRFAAANNEIGVINSTDGINWNSPIRVSTDAGTDWSPSIIQNSSDGKYLIAYSSQRSGNYEIWIRNSSDGVGWSAAPIQVTNNASLDYYPSLLRDSAGKYWIAWSSTRTGNYDIWITNSSDTFNWANPIRVTTNISTDYVPSIIEDASKKYWIFWTSNRSGNWDVWYSTSVDGTSWLDPVQFTTNYSFDGSSSVVQDKNKTYWIVWRSNRSDTGNYYNIWISHSTVSMTSPNEGENWSGNKDIVWASVSGDLQNDSFDLHWSADGISWRPLAIGLPNNTVSYAWDTTTVGDGNYTIKITRINSNAGIVCAVRALSINNNPPSPISNLTNTTSITWLNWTWTAPPETDFNHTMVYLDGVFQTNVSANYFNATSLEPGTQHVISTRSVDTAGNVNSTWVNQSARTLYPPPNITSFAPPTEVLDVEYVQRTFNISVNQTINVTWRLNGTQVQQNLSIAEANYINLSARAGIYNVSAAAENVNGSTMKTWTWTVQDVTPPASVTNLTNTTYEATYITWNWTNPGDADFSHAVVYLNGTWKANVSKPLNSYTATELSGDTEYTISTRTVDTNGNVNSTWINNTTRTFPKDTTPPSSVSGLTNTTFEQTYINWTWSNPTEPDFTHVMIYVDGVWQANVSVNHYSASGLNPSTNYTISTRTVDFSGNINSTWVNHTARTAPRRGVSISVSPSSNTVEIGENATYNVTITNTGTERDTIEVWALSLGMDIVDANKTTYWIFSSLKQSITLDAGESASRNVTVVGYYASNSQMPVFFGSLTFGGYPLAIYAYSQSYSWSSLSDIDTTKGALSLASTTVLPVAEISADATKKTGVPGENLTYNVTIKNVGLRAHNFSLNVTSDANAAYVSQNYTYLNVSESATILLTVNHPGISTKYTTVTVGENGTPYASVKVESLFWWEPIYRCSVKFDPGWQIVGVGKNATFNVTITNTGNVQDKYTLLAGTDRTVEPGYYRVAEGKTDFNKSKVLLEPGESTVRPFIAYDLNVGGGTYNHGVMAISEAAFADYPFCSNMAGTIVGGLLYLKSSSNAQTVNKTQNATYKIYVKNNIGYPCPTYPISCGTSDIFSQYYMQPNLNLSITSTAENASISNASVRLRGGYSTDVMLNVSSATSGTYKTTVKVWLRDDPSVNTSIDITTLAIDRPIYGVSLSTDEERKAVNKTENATFMLTLTNLGNMKDTFNLSMSNPNGADAELSTNSISVNPGSYASVYLRVHGSSGSYPVSVRATSQGDTDIYDEVETTTIIKEMNGTINDSASVDEYSSINNSSIGSVIRFSVIKDSNISNATIINSEVYSSKVTNSTLVSIIIRDANVQNDYISSGSVTIGGVTYNISAPTKMADILTGADERRKDIAALANETKEIQMNNSNAKITLSAKKDLIGGSVSLQRSKVRPSGTSNQTNNVGGYINIKASKNIEAGMSHSLIRVYYSDADVGSLDESTLRLQYFNTNTNAWEDLPGTVNTAGNYVEATTTHFSFFGISGNPPAPSQPAASGSGGTARREPVPVIKPTETAAVTPVAATIAPVITTPPPLREQPYPVSLQMLSIPFISLVQGDGSTRIMLVSAALLISGWIVTEYMVIRRKRTR
jgi:hypothetical protein